MKLTNPNLVVPPQCSVLGSGGVRADFGRHCEPQTLTHSQMMRRRRITKLYCIGSWRETAGYTSVLMRMENAPLLTWCLHYKTSTLEDKTSTLGGQDEFYSIFLSLEGKCSHQAFSDAVDLTGPSSMYGFMAGYVSGNDTRCSDDTYTQRCEDGEHSCLESHHCPSQCQRCVQPVSNVEDFCMFDSEAYGNYQLIGRYRQDFNVTITQKMINGTTFGEFECRGFADSGIPGKVYPVVQAGSCETCMPYFACAQVTTLTTGVIAFYLRSAIRDANTGRPMSCWETHQELGEITPVFLQKTVTLVDTSQLSESPCDTPRSVHPTSSGGCRIVVEECTGSCTTLRVGYDQISCPRTTVNPYNIERKHTCRARLNFKGAHAILARSNDVGRELCWVFIEHMLYIAKASECNQDAIDQRMKSDGLAIKYNPFNAISQPVSGSGGDGEYEIYGSSHSRSSGNPSHDLNHIGLLVVLFLVFCR